MINNKLIKYIFIKNLDEKTKKNIKKFNNIKIIYNNEDFNNISLRQCIEIRNFCFKNKISLYVINNYKIAVKIKANGIFISSTNRRINLDCSYLKKLHKEGFSSYLTKDEPLSKIIPFILGFAFFILSRAFRTKLPQRSVNCANLIYAYSLLGPTIPAYGMLLILISSRVMVLFDSAFVTASLTLTFSELPGDPFRNLLISSIDFPLVE